LESNDLLRAVGEVIWGPHWRREMVSALGVGDRPLRRWAAGEVEPPPGVWRELLATIEERQQQLTAVRNELTRRQQTEE
jgi:hypothetical protein